MIRSDIGLSASILREAWKEAEEEALDQAIGAKPAPGKTDAEIQENLSLVSSGRDSIVAKLPPPLAITTTDAEGRFTFPSSNMRSGRALSACAERHLSTFGRGPSVEYYCWLVTVPDLKTDQISVMLTGSNMIGVGEHEESLVKK